MAFLAKAGFDVFSMDTTGYGRSTRPPAMNDPCNFSKEQQAQFVPSVIPAPCAPSHSARNYDDGVGLERHRSGGGSSACATTCGEGLARSLVAGRPRAGGYAARNPDKVARLVVLAPA